MAKKGLLCVKVNCPRPDCVFAFVRGKGKLPAWPEHLSTFSSQGLLIFDITVYDFMESEEDHLLYLQRKAQVRTEEYHCIGRDVQLGLEGSRETPRDGEILYRGSCGRSASSL